MRHISGTFQASGTKFGAQATRNMLTGTTCVRVFLQEDRRFSCKENVKFLGNARSNQSETLQHVKKNVKMERILQLKYKIQQNAEIF